MIKRIQISLAEYPVEEIIPYLGADKPKIILSTEKDIFSVKASTTRLQCLKNNPSCVRCGKTGNIFKLECMGFFKESPVNQMELFADLPPVPPEMIITQSPHLNLYHCEEGSKPLLMTQDHILPKSKGGLDEITNLQTMCIECNNKKGNQLESEFSP